MTDVPVLGSLEPTFGVGLNAGVLDHVICLDQGRAVVCVVGNRLALASAAPEPIALPDDVPVEHKSMTFLPSSKHVRRVTAVSSDARRKTLAVCVEVDLAAERDERLYGDPDFDPDGAWATKQARISPFQVLVYNLAHKGAPRRVTTLTFDLALDAPPVESKLAAAKKGSKGMDGKDGKQDRPRDVGQPWATCAFSPDGTVLLAVSGAPESRAVGWHWLKNRVAFSSRCLALDHAREAFEAQAEGFARASANSAPGSPLRRSQSVDGAAVALHEQQQKKKKQQQQQRSRRGSPGNSLDADGNGSVNGGGGSGGGLGPASPGSRSRSPGGDRFADAGLLSEGGGAVALEVARVRFLPAGLAAPGGNDEVANGGGGGGGELVVSTSGPGHVRLWKVTAVTAPAVLEAAAAAVSQGLRPPELFTLAPLPPVRRMLPLEAGEAYTDHDWTVRAGKRVRPCEEKKKACNQHASSFLEAKLGRLPFIRIIFQFHGLLPRLCTT